MDIDTSIYIRGDNKINNYHSQTLLIINDNL